MSSIAPSKQKKRKPDVGGPLNSKHPNPYEIAYKELWDPLPDWKKVMFSNIIADGEFSEYGLYAEFVKSVVAKAEESHD